MDLEEMDGSSCQPVVANMNTHVVVTLKVIHELVR